MKKIFYSSLLLSLLQSILFWHKNKGISVVLFIIPTILVILYNLKENNMIKNKKGILWSIPIILLSLTYFIFNNSFFQILNIPVIFVLIIIMCIKITEQEILEQGFIRNIIKKAFKPFGVIFEFISDFEMDEFIEKQKDNQNLKTKTIKKVLKSMLISIPIILIIIALLSSADSVFGNMFNDVREFISKAFKSETITENIARGILIIIYLVYIMGFMITFIRKNEIQTYQNENRSISLLTANMILISLNIIYFVFSIIQFKYLFMNAGKTSDFDYATYARTGFFQLMFVSFINLLLLRIMKQNKDEFIKILKSLLIIFTIVIVISAMFRMHLYEQEYGYTYLRIFVYFVLITEILILIPILLNIYGFLGEKFNTFNVVIKIIVLMYIILNFINIDYIISSNNLNRYLENPKTNKIDYYYILRKTGTDAIEQKIMIYNMDTEGLEDSKKRYLETIKQSAKNYLKKHKQECENLDWQEWNLSKQKAHKLLKNIDL